MIRASASLEAVGVEDKLFTSCFTIGTLVDKLEESTQFRWFHYQVAHAEKVRGNAFNKWLRLQAKVAINYKNNVLRAVYHVLAQSEVQMNHEKQRAENLERMW